MPNACFIAFKRPYRRYKWWNDQATKDLSVDRCTLSLVGQDTYSSYNAAAAAALTGSGEAEAEADAEADTAASATALAWHAAHTQCLTCADTLKTLYISQCTGLYSQLAGVLVAFARLKDKNNSLLMHIIATGACLISISSMTAVLVKFSTTCVYADSGEETDQLYGPAFFFGAVAVIVNAVQLLAHLTSKHDPSLTFIAGTPIKYLCLDADSMCCKRTRRWEEGESRWKHRAHHDKLAAVTGLGAFMGNTIKTTDVDGTKAQANSYSTAVATSGDTSATNAAIF